MSRARTAVLFGLPVLVFGTSFAGIKAGLDAVPPALFAALRFDMGAALLLGFLALRARGDWYPRSRGDARAVLVAAVFLVYLNGLALFVGQQFTTSASAAVVYGIIPVATPVFAFFLLPSDRLTPLGVVGVLLGFAGVVVLVDPDPANLLVGSGVGVALVAVGALSSALGSVLLRRANPRLSSVPLTAWAMLVGAAAHHATSLALGESTTVAWTPPVVVAVVYVGTLATAVGFPAYLALIDHAGPIRANLTAYAIPLVAAAVGVLVLDEALSPSTVAGFLVVLLGFVLVEWRRLRADLRRLRRRIPPSPRTRDE